MPSTELFYVHQRMEEWGLGELPEGPRRSVEKVLTEMKPSALLFLKDARLEVRITPRTDYTVWAYFPVYARRHVAREFKLRPETRVLLVFSAPSASTEKPAVLEAQIRDHLGHVLLYLRDPKAPNDCPDAMREWRTCARPVR